VRQIHFDPISLAGPFDEADFSALTKMLALDLPSFEFDPEYASFIQQHQVGRPIERYFSTASGSCYPVDYFLNFQRRSAANDPNAFLNVNVVWSAIEDRLSCSLVPFASLPGGDFLCFDHSHPGRPSVVLWFHELSGEDSPVTEHVASNFSEFISGLRGEP